MEVNKILEDKLWSFSRDDSIDVVTGTRIINHLVAKLSNFLQVSLELVKEYLSEPITEGFCQDFRGVISSNDILFITCGVTLGMGLIGDDFISHTSANLYLFANHNRLITDKNQTYVYLDYVRDENGFGQWINRGWQGDEFWEYESIEEKEFF